MTAYVSRGDRVILYAGNLNIGQLEAFAGMLRREGVEVLASLTGSSAPLGRPEILAVIEADDTCTNCGYSLTHGDPFDGVIVDEAVGWSPEPGKTHTPVDAARDCDRTDTHHAHPWTPGGPDTVPVLYCKGVPA